MLLFACFDNETVEFLWCYWNMFWLLIRLSWWGVNPRARHTWVRASNLVEWALPMAGGMNSEFVNGPTWGRLRKRELTLRWCFRTLRAWRPPEPLETMHACRLIIFMHRGIWRDFLWFSYSCAFVSWWYCDSMTLIVWCVDCMSTVLLATAHVFFETHQGECRSTLGMRQGFPLYSGGFS